MTANEFILRNVRLDLDDLAEQVLDRTGRAGAIDFILALDAAAADLGFTALLRDKLDQAIEQEDPNYDALNSPTAQFLHWLVAMDDPDDEQGVKDRQTIRLSTIIDRARALLDGPR